jgi:hypothetical protein
MIWCMLHPPTSTTEEYHRVSPTGCEYVLVLLLHPLHIPAHGRMHTTLLLLGIGAWSSVCIVYGALGATHLLLSTPQRRTMT